MMKTLILLIGITIQSVMPTYAEKLINDELQPVHPAGTKVTACANGAGLWYQCESTPCEQQLREALKAVEPYLTWGDHSATIELYYCNERCRLQEQIEELDRREKVQARYDAAMKECGK